MKTYTVCPSSLDPFHVVSHYINWAKNSWTDSTCWFGPFYIQEERGNQNDKGGDQNLDFTSQTWRR